MTKKNETLILLFSLVLTIGLVGLGAWLLLGSEIGNFAKLPGNNKSTSTEGPNSPNLPVPERISTGEELLIPSGQTSEKQAAVKDIASGNYAQAVSSLETALKRDRNDPEALIYLNNARIGEAKSYTIGVSVPIGTNVDVAKEMLRGVAQAQTEVNRNGGIDGVPLKVAIANDDDAPTIAEQIAQEFVQNEEILGVVGNFSSGVTLASGKVYEQGQLVLISPTSSSVQLSGFSDYVFRTVPSDSFAANALSRYMLTQLQKKRAAVFFNADSNYSTSLKQEFSQSLFTDGGQIVDEFNLNSPDFNAVDAVQQAIERQAEVLMLAPDSSVLDKALQVVQVNDNRLQMLAGDSTYTLQTLKQGRSNAEGMVLAIPWHILENPQAEFPQAANQLWGAEVNWRTAMAYDATQALIAAIEQNPTRTGVQQALSASNFIATGAADPIQFLPSGDRNQAVQLVKIQKGNDAGLDYKFVPISSAAQ